MSISASGGHSFGRPFHGVTRGTVRVGRALAAAAAQIGAMLTDAGHVANSNFARCQFTTNASCTLSSVALNTAANAGNVVLIVRRVSDNVVMGTQTLSSTSAGFSTFTFAAPFTLAAGIYWMEIQNVTAGFIEGSSTGHSVSGVVSAGPSSNSLFTGAAFPPAAESIGFWLGFQLIGTAP